MTKYKQKIKELFFLIVFASLLTACSSPANRMGMTPVSDRYLNQTQGTIKVQVDGGSETSAIDTSNISNDELKAALEDSILNSRIFKGVINGKGGDYALQVDIISLSKPYFGATFNVELECVWTLIRTKDKAEVFKRAIISSGQATLSDALPAVTRLRIAVERAASENIKLGLKHIDSKL